MKYFLIRALNFLLLFLIYSSQVISQNIQFTDLQDLPIGKSSLTSATDGESIYLVNGFSNLDQYTSEILRYDISTDSWSILTSETIAKRYASAEIVGDYLYVFNGAIPGDINEQVEKISLLDGSVELLGLNPNPNRSGGVCSWNDKIYSFGGGSTPSTYSNLLYEFDPINDTWTILSEIPFQGETKGEIINGKLYVIGGYNGTVSDQIDVYDFASDSWEASFIMPTGISAHATALIGSKIYLVGDFTNLNSLAYFDTSNSSFYTLTSNMNSRRHCAAEGVSGSLYAIGGNTQSNINSSIVSVQRADIATSILSQEKAEEFEISPNPTSLEISLNRSFDEVIIYSINGQEMMRYNDANRIQIKDLQTGQYFIKAYFNGKLFQSKFIKSN